ncbi:hypothetical protein BCR42DRAFT_496863 [Absidia repens]|uniref:F-box domain-containing protein n=1 Tax=Absidia repens TaxID=90262 RepID=A0A1X2HY46_9FUNG|nr:hypothetical protein BCR42DRAFT_496863 [Absidia repens]
MPPRKPLKRIEENTDEFTTIHYSSPKIKRSTRCGNGQQSLQTSSPKPNPKTMTNNTSAKQQPSPQPITRTSRWSQPKRTTLSSKEVITTIGLSPRKSEKPPLQTPLQSSPEPLELPYFFLTEQPPSPESEWSRSYDLEPGPTSESQPCMLENIDHVQSMQISMGTSIMDQTPHLLKRQLPKSHRQTRPTTDITEDLPSSSSRLGRKSTLARNRSTSLPPLKRVHYCEPHSPPSQLDIDDQQPRLQPLTTPFILETTSSRRDASSPPRTTSLQSYTHSPSTIPMPSSSNTHQEFHQPQLIDEHSTIPDTLIDHSGDTQQTGNIVWPNILYQSWTRRLALHGLFLPIYQPPDLDKPPPDLAKPPPDLAKSPPIYNLNDDCLIEILKWCATTQTLCVVSSVCKHWRNVALLPYVWRTIDYTWSKLIQQLESTSEVDTMRLTEPPDTSIFINLRTLQLSNMHYKDILDLIAWTKHLNELDCNGILSHTSNDVVMITPFSNLRKLHVLKLHFATTCELIGPTSLTSDNSTGNIKHSTTDRWRFSPNLHTLNITNIYDIEEFLTSGNSASRSALLNQQQRQAIVVEERMNEMMETWNLMENTLVIKYRVLSTLRNLTNLSLGKCTGYTARIWRECIAPCSKNLKQLSLCGWIGDGNREAPLAWKERYDMATMTDKPVNFYMEDVEKALAEMFAGLYHLQSLNLVDFKCTTGLAHGMDRLVEATGKSFLCNNIQPTMNNLINKNRVRDSSLDTLKERCAVSSSLAYFRDSLGCHFANTKIELYDGSSVVRKKNKIS